MNHRIFRTILQLVIGGLLLWSVDRLATAEVDEKVPSGLPVLNAPADNPVTPAKINLGRKLFFDQRLSANGNISCASCHVPDKAFSDGKPLAEGIEKKRGTRNTPSIINAGYNKTQFWDGRRNSLEEQALDPFVNPNEHGLASLDDLMQRIRSNKTYAPFFKQAFGSSSAETPVHVGQALATFVRSLATGNSPVDHYLYGGDKTELTANQRYGLELFRGRAQCTACHLIGEHDALLTDHDYHSLAIGFDRLVPKLATLVKRVARAHRKEMDRLILEDVDVAALGRFVVTLNPKDIGKFKTPSLRNVALTAPYMHDGSITTLEDAVNHEIYYRGQDMGRPLILTPQERSDLVAFLQALTSVNLPR